MYQTIFVEFVGGQIMAKLIFEKINFLKLYESYCNFLKIKVHYFLNMYFNILYTD